LAGGGRDLRDLARRNPGIGRDGARQALARSRAAVEAALDPQSVRRACGRAGTARVDLSLVVVFGPARGLVDGTFTQDHFTALGGLRVDVRSPRSDDLPMPSSRACN